MSWHKRAIAITGSPGSGKTTVAKLFKTLGAEVIDADELSRAALSSGSPGYLETLLEFGHQILIDPSSEETSEIDRKKLAAQVFSDPEKKLALESIVHPIVQAKAAELAAKVSEQQLLIYDCPLLFEAGLDKLGFKKTIVVSTSSEKASTRFIKRTGLNQTSFNQRSRAQLPLSEKEALADIVLDNSGSIEDLEQLVAELFKTLSKPVFK